MAGSVVLSILLIFRQVQKNWWKFVSEYYRIAALGKYILILL